MNKKLILSLFILPITSFIHADNGIIEQTLTIEKQIENLLNINVEEYYVEEPEVNKFIDQFYSEYKESVKKSLNHYDKEKKKLYSLYERDIKNLDKKIYYIEVRYNNNCVDKVNISVSNCEKEIKERELIENQIRIVEAKFPEIDKRFELKKLEHIKKLREKAFFDRTKKVLDLFNKVEK